MKINRILLLFFVLVVLSSFASALVPSVHTELVFNETFDDVACSGDCWGTPNLGGAWQYLNATTKEWTIANKTGYVKDNTVVGTSHAESSFTPSKLETVIVRFQWKLNSTNTVARIIFFNNTKFDSTDVSIWGGGSDHLDLKTGYSTNTTTFFHPTANKWFNVTLKFRYKYETPRVEVYVNNNTISANYSMSSKTRTMKKIGIGEHQSAGSRANVGLFDNITIMGNTSYSVAFLREASNSWMNMSNPLISSAKFKVVCPSGTIETNIKSIYPYLQTTTNCNYTSLMVVMDYNGTTYSRTLIPPYSQNSVDFYLLDLTTDSAVEKDVTLNDLTGDFQNGTLIVKKSMSSGIETITENQFDITHQVVLYLLRDNIYTVHIKNSKGEERVLGNLFATTGNIELTFPIIQFAPDHRLDFNSIRWEYTYNTTLLRVHYEDLNFNTTRVQFYVLNATNHSQSFFNSVINGNTSNDATFSYNIVSPNGTFYACLNFTHANLGNHQDCNTYSQNKQIDVLDGLPNATAIKFWSALIIIICIGLSFGYAHAGIGAIITTFFTMVAIGIGWFPLNAYTTSMVAIMALFSVLAFIIDERKKP